MLDQPEDETCNLPAPVLTYPSKNCRQGHLVSLDVDGLIDHVFTIDGESVIGRSRQCQVRVSQQECSRKHARVFFEDDTWFIEDLESANGTRVMRKRVSRKSLKSGDNIHIATIPFRFLLPTDPELMFHQAVQTNATIDPLTRLYNRDFIQQRTTAALCSNINPMFFIIDLDCFKEVNDEFGHLVGDEVLLEVGTRIKNVCGDQGFAARISGDEFGLLVEDASTVDAAELSEAICDAIRDQPILTQAQPLAMTVSVGAASLPEDGVKTISDLMGSADRQLYKAKLSGRDRGCVQSARVAKNS
ncbi:GGDEF domain-containing protein [bacterium]|nr:GGDEF domain-containing protein [bacterium]